MAHALRRISFATCDPEHHQFSFLAREPDGHNNIQYCHSFIAKDPRIAEELSGVVSSAFRMAYAQQLRHLENAASPAGRQGRSHWAKKIIGKIKHSDPIVTQAMELGNWVFSNNCDETISHVEQSPTRNSNSISPKPHNLPIDLSPINNSFSSDENNSPNDVNSCKQIKDKPLLLKNLDVIDKNKKTCKELQRPSSESHISSCKDWGSSSLKELRVKTKSDVEESQSMKEYSVDCCNQTPTAPPTDENHVQGGTENSIEKDKTSCSDTYNTASLCQSEENTPLNLNEEINIIGFCKNKTLEGTGASSSIVKPPPPPERHDSLYITVTEEQNLRGAPWFQAGIPREITLEILAKEPIGSFMVRESTSKPGCFALSLRVPRDCHQSGIAHYLIMRTNRGYKIKGFTKEFPTLTSLITHHSVMPELLPCPLSLSKYNPSFRKHDSNDMEDIHDDPDYNLLSDFRRMLTNVNV